jgi:hypothetical protein
LQHHLISHLFAITITPATSSLPNQSTLQTTHNHLSPTVSFTKPPMALFQSQSPSHKHHKSILNSPFNLQFQFTNQATPQSQTHLPRAPANNPSKQLNLQSTTQLTAPPLPHPTAPPISIITALS